ncbi:hypothetical protein C2G38_2154390 [Gigaspora rosea]|uniref:Uncharacterized protein n=1 Tax=Gigaspora rosea TaxID=44941 RepID=A0A397W512_9GLOM|nr:hypothetical protein C2G38_2154390 [Gigaspora rosea]
MTLDGIEQLDRSEIMKTISAEIVENALENALENARLLLGDENNDYDDYDDDDYDENINDDNNDDENIDNDDDENIDIDDDDESIDGSDDNNNINIEREPTPIQGTWEIDTEAANSNNLQQLGICFSYMTLDQNQLYSSGAGP